MLLFTPTSYQPPPCLGRPPTRCCSFCGCAAPHLSLRRLSPSVTGYVRWASGHRAAQCGRCDGDPGLRFETKRNQTLSADRTCPQPSSPAPSDHVSSSAVLGCLNVRSLLDRRAQQALTTALTPLKKKIAKTQSRCGPLLSMSQVAWSVCLADDVLHKMDEPIESRFGGRRVGLGNHDFTDGVQICLPLEFARRGGVCQIRWTLVFTARCYASAVLAMGLCLCLSVSVTSRSYTKTAKRRITQTTPHDSPGTLVFRRQRSPRNSTGVTPYEGAECRWGGSKSATFD